MDPHLLRTFVTVARRGSFSAAAAELGYTQSAVSQHIAALEADLSAVLLRRRPVLPTEAGRLLLEHAGPLLLRLDAARADVARLVAEPTGRLTVGATPLALTPEVAHRLAGLRAAHPRWEVTIRVLDRDAVPAAVSSGALDAGLTDGMTAPNDPLSLPETGPLAVTAVSERPLHVTLPTTHPLATRAGLRLPDLADAYWLDAPATAIPLTHLRTACPPGPFRARLRYEATDLHGLALLIAAGEGLALLPALGGLPGVTQVPLRAPRSTHRVELLTGGATHGPAAALREALASPAVGGG
ncbi:LysR family transcriptional regulator [Streptomyces huiliensis]|uniref:LysR family transcriptional regulator n=1 Tax=Streptomyces huiliensis TaxID=2876027 RepID=UPI001CBAF23A|nr:LysR family transcriptional regulator [Streptomyces huiliensis]MBZ4320758.1 LysR family transcriptional regulator [Streptomyces huiliensis]